MLFKYLFMAQVKIYITYNMIVFKIHEKYACFTFHLFYDFNCSECVSCSFIWFWIRIYRYTNLCYFFFLNKLLMFVVVWKTSRTGQARLSHKQRSNLFLEERDSCQWREILSRAFSIVIVVDDVTRSPSSTSLPFLSSEEFYLFYR